VIVRKVSGRISRVREFLEVLEENNLLLPKTH